MGGGTRYKVIARALLHSLSGFMAALSSLQSVARSWSLQFLAACAVGIPLEASQDWPAARFGSDVQPILEGRCLKCHGGGKRLRGGLRLTSREGVLAGGDSGPAIDLEEPGESLLLAMVRWVDEDHQMPPTGKLADEEVATLSGWVEAGAPWPEGVSLVSPEQAVETSADAIAGDSAASLPLDPMRGWSYRPLVRPEVPRVTNASWVRNPLDAFVLARLEAAGFEPDPEASRVSLIRRLTYDLTGLPPTPEEVDAFLADHAPDAWERLVERLLASPHYGERWGRHWLDLVRYAETNGYERDTDKPFMWRYRDWVIEALNADMPFDRFALEQLAGDELDSPTPSSITASGYLRLMVWDDEPPEGKLKGRYDVLDDITSTTAQVFLGMTIGCARCHDHKRDPIPQTDYYRFMAFFHGLTDMTVEGTLADVGSAEERARCAEAGAGAAMAPVLALAAAEGGPVPSDLFLHVRGNPAVPGERVDPGLPVCLNGPPIEIAEAAVDAKSSGRRRALAEWIASPSNPLTPRVIANRVWQFHFGRGIVRTPNDFGELGERPTHPELLDWLACELVARGWSLKEIHRLIVGSSAYRMASTAQELALERDPTNDLFWRFDLQRLGAEAVRDSALAVSGELNLELHGPSVFVPIPEEVLATSSRPHEVWGASPPDQAARRSIYIKVKRSLIEPVLARFDLADTDSSCAARFTTTQPGQALAMLNGAFFHERARAFAERLEREAGADRAAEVRRALRLVLAREPATTEIDAEVRFLEGLERDFGLSPLAALERFCLVTLNRSEFLYLD